MNQAGDKLRADALALLEAAVAAADPARLMRETLRLSHGKLEARGVDEVYDLNQIGDVLVVGSGKAGAPMALALEELLGERIAAGRVVVKEGYDRTGAAVADSEAGAGEPAPQRVVVREASHPIPDERASREAADILALASRAGEDDLVICLLSGGGSALMALPAGGLSLADIQATTNELLRSGATIDEVNAVRKHITLGAAGRLAAAAYPAKMLALIVSDVIGDRLDVIASGPTVPDGSTFADALDVIERYRLAGRLPEAVLAHIRAGAAGRFPETPKPGDPIFKNVRNTIIGSNRTALDAAVLDARARGYHVLGLTGLLTGEAREAARVFAAIACEEALRGEPLALPACILAGGETTVTVTGAGRGGRAQEFALAAALGLADSCGAAEALVFAAGTDGTDGPTDAAGAFADCTTIRRGINRGLDGAARLAGNDAYPFFQALGDLIVTGPTETNVNDIYGVLVPARR